MQQVNIQSTHGIGITNGVKILVYGKPGMGKTVLCATAPNPIIFSAEGGLLSLSRFQLPFVEVKTIADLQNLYHWARSSQEARQFQTLCLDSLSEIGETVLAEAKKNVKDGRLAYGDLIERMTSLIRSFRDLPGFHVYMSAKEQYRKEGETGISRNGPSMPGAKLAQDLPYFFDEVFQLEIAEHAGNTFRYLRTQPDFANIAKDRSGVLEPMEEPNLTKIIGKILGGTP